MHRSLTHMGAGTLADVRQWSVAGAIVERSGSLLLVRNRRRDGRIDWSPPGGVVDLGESPVVGLAREVQEETGLVIEAWDGPLYTVGVLAPGLRWDLTVEVHRGTDPGDALVVDDPDGIVDDAEFTAAGDIEARLAAAPPWVSDPVLEGVADGWTTVRHYRYEVEGERIDELCVTRVA